MSNRNVLLFVVALSFFSVVISIGQAYACNPRVQICNEQ